MQRFLTLAPIVFLISLQARPIDISKTESFFLKASENLFNMNFAKARKYYLRAYRAYKHIKDEKKMNECLMGIATVESCLGNYEEALSLFKKCKREHLLWNKIDTEGLELIDISILVCEKQLYENRRKSSSD